MLKAARILVNEGPGALITSFRTFLKTRKKSSYIRQADLTAKDGNRQPLVNEKKYIADLFNMAKERPPEYVLLSQNRVELTGDDVKLIAFYLPQFHPIPENDQWWGKGFTEWTNVTKAVPQFVGHYQPHLPDELGFYDLRLVDVQKRQVELAKQYGIYGFCFYYYWFNGKRLLEKPLDQFIEHREIDFPFCICWANENWTRRWDGFDSEVLIAQSHDARSDLQFIKDLEPYLRDPRYIRINGKPLLLIYRVKLLHDAREAAKVWREYCIKSGIGDLYLIAVQSPALEDPREYGFDAAVQFPPNTMVCNNITNKFTILNPNFKGNVFDYREYVRSKRYLEPKPYKQFKNVSPSWDNTPRRPDNGTIYWGADPESYKEWLTNVIEYTKKEFSGDERIVFINAWNEWAEGAHLEPDRKYGYGYLQATADALLASRETPVKMQKKILYVSHDAYYHGAQLLALNTVRVLKEQFHYDVHVILKKGGRLESDFRKYAQVYNLETKYTNIQAVEKLIERLHRGGVSIAICNTVVTGDIVMILSKNGIKVISLVHEMPKLIHSYKMENNAALIPQYADKVVFPSTLVKEKYQEIADVSDNKCAIVPQGLYLNNVYKGRKDEARMRIRQELGIPKSAHIILAVGYADLRKGPDLFVEVAKKVIPTIPNSYFIWVGHYDDQFMKNVLSEVKKSKYADHILFLGIRDDIGMFYAGADLYLMTSREDPFPSTILEAMDAGTPVIGFDEAGGFRDIVTEDTGRLVPYLNVEAMGERAIELLNDEGLRKKLGDNASRLISEKYQFTDYIYTLLGLLGHNYKKVSVIVPNYNYARYLMARLQSIASQDYPIYEIIVLDDCSSDNSIEIIRDFASNSTIPVKLEVNEKNCGSVFRQWAKGIEMAKGDYIWIAEADDLCEAGFLSEVMKGFSNPEVVLSYCQSKQIDETGRVTANDYLYYTQDIDEEKWKNDYVRDGINEIIDSLVVKNTIPNVSGVIFKKYDISEILDELTEFKVAGDWFFYVWLLQKGKISYHAKSLNIHRRHTGGVTLSENSQKHFDEIARMQDYIMKHFKVDEITRKKVLEYREKVHEQLLGSLVYSHPPKRQKGVV
ncbi:glycoside hydrolase family 99-like domain-containing protein [Methanocella conradii]|uniref:glycoside hydrolase family 99-like domain-containing protein n=1 Tax=Methanocella conradii TaxID=1175444 RepID=UPI0024B3340E|nr:glycoside hydrolase family 99-like domain-containing protein [Methanocella conradii]MDI6896839.1 glycoside hydrolase family 99-like domain-containing protein [Methanocella conradii]